MVIDTICLVRDSNKLMNILFVCLCVTLKCPISGSITDNCTQTQDMEIMLLYNITRFGCSITHTHKQTDQTTCCAVLFVQMQTQTTCLTLLCLYPPTPIILVSPTTDIGFSTKCYTQLYFLPIYIFIHCIYVLQQLRYTSPP